MLLELEALAAVAVPVEAPVPKSDTDTLLSPTVDRVPVALVLLKLLELLVVSVLVVLSVLLVLVVLLVLLGSGLRIVAAAGVGFGKVAEIDLKLREAL